MNSANPHSAAYALLVLESIVKNCGSPVHDEICTKESCEWFTNYIETTAHEKCKAKMLELMQVWAFAFRTYDKYQAIRDIVTILKQKGHQFPELKEADAMFTSETAPDWSDGKVCSRCRTLFSFTLRKHHCRNCGRIFCGQCSNKTCTLPKFGIEKEVRVCDGCFASLHKSGGADGGLKREGSATSTESDLPAEYLASTLAQQSQQPPRKSEQELKEEEELQLALALSQSEAEAQKGSRSGASNSQYRNLNAALGKSTTTADSSSANLSLSFASGGSPAVTTATASGVATGVGRAATATTSSTNGGYDHSAVGGDAELSKYLNRDYWEQRKVLDSPASPSAPSPMSQTSSHMAATAAIAPKVFGAQDAEIREFSDNMRLQMEIFVNRMKSNSSRGRNIVTDSAVQSLFMQLTSYHSRLLTHIKDMDDKRMWYEQLQDKLAQVKDSRAALDVLRQEHQDKLRLLAEEQERQRQLMMAHKLDIMRKKKQEYLQYQRQMALQRIQEQEREMAMRQEQQKALYQMGGGGGGGVAGGMPFGQMGGVGVGVPVAQGSSPLHQQQLHQMYGGQAAAYGQPPHMMLAGAMGPMPQQQHPSNMYGSLMAQQQQQQPQQPIPPNQQMGMQPGQPGQPGQPQPILGMPPNGMHMQMQPPVGQYNMGVAGPPMPMQQQQQPSVLMSPPQPQQQQQLPQQMPQPMQQLPQQPQQQQQLMQQPSAVAALPSAAPVAVAPEVPAVAVVKAPEPAEAELISFD